MTTPLEVLEKAGCGLRILKIPEMVNGFERQTREKSKKEVKL